MRLPSERQLSLARLVKATVELAVVSGAFVLAYLLRFDFDPAPEDWVRFQRALPIAIGVKAFALWYLGLFGNWWWRYVGVPDLMRIIKAVTLASVAMAAVMLASLGGFPRSVIGIDWAFSLVALLGVTGASRILRDGVANGSRAGRPTLIVGAGEAGVRLVNELKRDAQLRLRPLGFVDDDRAKEGGWVQGLRVLGTRHDLPDLVTQLRVEEIVIAIPSAGRREIREIVDACKATGLPIRIVPPTRDLLSRDPEHTRLRSVQIEDLLGRPAVRFEPGPVEAALSSRVILVTGAGGSIGSELCRQIATCSPARLVILDRYENTLYYLEQELRERRPELALVSVIADVSDRDRVEAVIAEHRPQVIFHAAAHKHVPLMEQNPGEAVRNNVVGTRTVAELALEHGVERFVLISTDKAIRPSSVMGCTKRVAELVLQALQGRGATRFVVVRFGNVLGSEGSVVPLFGRQIARGGPVTVTHPDAVRYFMLIPEAVHLVLHAGVLGEGGEIFYLDMGEPVRVLDLAIDMIRLSGYRPYEDIDIRFTGLRAGEKLAEELRGDGERLGETAHAGVRVLLNGQPPAWAELERALEQLEQAVGRHDTPGVRALLRRLVPEYGGIQPGDVAIVSREARLAVQRSA